MRLESLAPIREAVLLHRYEQFERHHGSEIAEKKLNGEYIYELGVLHNHMSLSKINDWLYANMGQNSAYIYMHCHQDKEDAT